MDKSTTKDKSHADYEWPDNRAFSYRVIHLFHTVIIFLSHMLGLFSSSFELGERWQFLKLFSGGDDRSSQSVQDGSDEGLPFDVAKELSEMAEGYGQLLETVDKYCENVDEWVVDTSKTIDTLEEICHDRMKLKRKNTRLHRKNMKFESDYLKNRSKADEQFKRENMRSLIEGKQRLKRENGKLHNLLRSLQWTGNLSADEALNLLAILRREKNTIQNELSAQTMRACALENESMTKDTKLAIYAADIAQQVANIAVLQTLSSLQESKIQDIEAEIAQHNADLVQRDERVAELLNEFEAEVDAQQMDIMQKHALFRRILELERLSKKRGVTVKRHKPFKRGFHRNADLDRLSKENDELKARLRIFEANKTLSLSSTIQAPSTTPEATPQTGIEDLQSRNIPVTISSTPRRSSASGSEPTSPKGPPTKQPFHLRPADIRREPKVSISDTKNTGSENEPVKTIEPSNKLKLPSQASGGTQTLKRSRQERSSTSSRSSSIDHDRKKTRIFGDEIHQADKPMIDSDMSEQPLPIQSYTPEFIETELSNPAHDNSLDTRAYRGTRSESPSTIRSQSTNRDDTDMHLVSSAPVDTEFSPGDKSWTQSPIVINMPAPTRDDTMEGVTQTPIHSSPAPECTNHVPGPRAPEMWDTTIETDDLYGNGLSSNQVYDSIESDDIPVQYHSQTETKILESVEYTSSPKPMPEYIELEEKSDSSESREEGEIVEDDNESEISDLSDTENVAPDDLLAER